jgi:hypothetical protein
MSRSVRELKPNSPTPEEQASDGCARLFVVRGWIEPIVTAGDLRGDVAGVDIFRNARSITLAGIAEAAAAARPVRDHTASWQSRTADERAIHLLGGTEV